MSVSPQAFSPSSHPTNKSRLIAFLVAGFVCLAVAMTLGYGAWYLFGTHERPAASSVEIITNRPPASAPPMIAVPESAPSPVLAPEIITAPAGELEVAAAEVVLGGEAGLPLRREAIAEFKIAETEVTNEQYQHFIQATKHQAPPSWTNAEFPAGAGQMPVTEVSREDAVAYCEWLANEIGATVRLPSEAEWVLAARGTDDRRYPWGNEWQTEAALGVEEKGEVRPVKSFPAGRSPSGAFEMVGNVWEWTSDAALDEEGRERTKDGVKLYIVKGGSAGEPRSFLTITARAAIKETSRRDKIGFRYVVVRR